jgi:hypothetical protein
VTLAADALVAAACEATGFDDFGGDEWREGLDRFLDSLRREVRFHDLGETVAEAQVGAALETRLRIIDWHATHPDLATAPVPAPVVIVGQPRTGTTILFDLLAQDPGLRAPLTWEVGRPVPPPRTATYETDPRIAEADLASSMTETIIPGFQAIHPAGAQRAQECVAITNGDFRSLLWSTVYPVPSYTRWLLHEADMASAYGYHRRFLQVLQSEHAGDRWLLKTPGHQWCLADLFAAYPDATIIHTHRDPLKVTASVASLTAHLQRLVTDDSSIPERAVEWFDHLVLGNDRSVAARDDGTVPSGRAIDVTFADLMADTFGTIAGLYDRLGRELTADTEAAMRAFLADNAADKHGTHTYSFADTGLDPAACRERTVAYEERFGVPREVS